MLLENAEKTQKCLNCLPHFSSCQHTNCCCLVATGPPAAPRPRTTARPHAGTPAIPHALCGDAPPRCGCGWRRACCASRPPRAWTTVRTPRLAPSRHRRLSLHWAPQRAVSGRCGSDAGNGLELVERVSMRDPRGAHPRGGAGHGGLRPARRRLPLCQPGRLLAGCPRQCHGAHPPLRGQVPERHEGSG